MSIDAGYIRNMIDLVRTEIGRDVIFYTPTITVCPLCLSGNYLDPITGTSFNFNCPTCKGTGWASSVTANTILARIHWTNDEAITATPGGKYFVGDCQIHIEPEYLSIAEAAQSDGGKVVIDGHEMSITKIIPVGTPTINRIRVICTNMGARPT